ncbi:unnamed protein product [Pneumocystis jirovecii]|uniref:Proteasome assembly chaperone 3 n=2 Tax=Pneumocystis jirovecii TaxID=42068 RepID=L0PGL9_PNEJI|nr:uncharacterized protein T551_03259 [Pneumocystis jirovecii RU7]KTW26797.1 hypothetical protein T551_03259 [Pneumocystis jirovecii RU7]CCJ31536.1 unnamed protein product [Pneumocystis jirovecii]
MDHTVRTDNTPRQTACLVDGQHIELFVQGFLDCILVIVTMRGSVSEWVSVSLNSIVSAMRETFIAEEDGLGLPYLSPKLLLGASHRPHADMACMYASQIATHIVQNQPKEQRTVLVGLGLDWKQSIDTQQNLYKEIIKMLEECRVW